MERVTKRHLFDGDKSDSRGTTAGKNEVLGRRKRRKPERNRKKREDAKDNSVK